MRSPYVSTGGDSGETGTRQLCNHLLHAFFFCSTMVVLAKFFTVLPDWQDVIVAESGPVERMSAGVWFMITVWCLASGSRQSPYRIEWLGLTTLCLLFGLRELDAHIWATGWNLDKLANYWNSGFPLWERLLVAGFMIIPSMVVALILCYRVWLRLGEARSQHASWIGQLTIGGLLLGLCVVLDKVNNHHLALVGMDGGQGIIMGMEEFLEFVLGIYSVSVLWNYWQQALFSDGTAS